MTDFFASPKLTDPAFTSKAPRTLTHDERAAILCDWRRGRCLYENAYGDERRLRLQGRIHQLGGMDASIHSEINVYYDEGPEGSFLGPDVPLNLGLHDRINWRARNQIVAFNGGWILCQDREFPHVQFTRSISHFRFSARRIRETQPHD